MRKRFFLFGIGALIGVIFLSIGPENRLKTTFYSYLDYFDIDKRVITHLQNDSTTFSTVAECQLVYYQITKDDLLLVLDNGDVNFDLSQKDREPCQYYVIDNTINKKTISVTFEYCDRLNTVRVISFIFNGEKEVCNF